MIQSRERRPLVCIPIPALLHDQIILIGAYTKRLAHHIAFQYDFLIYFVMRYFY